MADAPHIPDEAETRAKWGDFAWTPENAKTAAMYIARYPAGRQASAVMALLDLADRIIWLEEGRVFADKPKHEVLAMLRGQQQQRAA